MNIRVLVIVALLASWINTAVAAALFVGSPSYLGLDVYETATAVKTGAMPTGSNTAYGIGFMSSEVLYVGSPSYTGIAVYNIGSGLQTSFINLPFAVSGIAFGDDSKAYVSSGGFTGISIYDQTTFTLVGQIASFNSYAGLAFGPGGELLAGSGAFSGLEVFDVSTKLKTRTISIPNISIYGVAYDNVSGSLYLGSPSFLGVDVYDSQGTTKTGHIAFQSTAFGLALRPSEIPEPRTLALIIGSLGMIAWQRRQTFLKIKLPK